MPSVLRCLRCAYALVHLSRSLLYVLHHTFSGAPSPSHFAPQSFSFPSAHAHGGGDGEADGGGDGEVDGGGDGEADGGGVGEADGGGEGEVDGGGAGDGAGTWQISSVINR